MSAPQPLKGLTFVLVGGFSAYHYEVDELIEQHGGTVHTFIAPHTTYVVRGDRISPQNVKIAHAQQYGVPIISEADLEAMIRGAYDAEERNVVLAVERETNQDYGTW